MNTVFFKGKISIIINWGMYIGFFAAMFVCIFAKRNLHTDEVSTYVLSNNSYGHAVCVDPEWYRTYENPEEVWLKNMAVQEGHGFDYKNVWYQQTFDVHPPLYYCLVHTISSFFPGKYSVWFAGSINIIFGLLTLLYLRKIVRYLTKNEIAVFLVSCSLILSSGVLSATTFLRMYIMAMFFVTLITYLFIRGLNERGPKFYIEIMTVSVMGALTHYYYIIYLFHLCLIFGIILLKKKEFSGVILSALSIIMSGILAVICFPNMIEQSIGGGYRGAETISNLSHGSLAEYLNRVRSCFDIVDSQLFGGLFFLYLVIGLILYFVERFILKKKMVIQIDEWLLLGTPVFFYFMSISKAAVYLTDRYFHPIYAVLIGFVVTTLYMLLNDGFEKRKAVIIMSVLLVLGSVKDFRTNWFYLYRHSGELVELSSYNKDKNCIYIMNDPNEINPSFYEIRNYNSVTFVPIDELEKLEEIDVDCAKGLIVSCGKACDQEAIAEAVYETWPQLDDYEKLGDHSFSVTYYFYNKK